MVACVALSQVPLVGMPKSSSSLVTADHPDFGIVAGHLLYSAAVQKLTVAKE